MNTIDWYQFQEDICLYFQSIGASAETNVTVRGVRTNHDIDILVKTKFLGEDLTWVIEAKKWKKKVNKLQVLALRTIVDEIGADRGFIVSEAGFQSGAYEATNNTNVKLKTFEELKRDTKELVENEIIKTHIARLNLLEKRYYSHSKSVRIDYGLTGEYCMPYYDFCVADILMTAQRALIFAERKEYPIKLDTVSSDKVGDLVVDNFQQLTNWLNLNCNWLDQQLFKAESEMYLDGEYKPRNEKPFTEKDGSIRELIAEVYFPKNKC